MDITVLVVYKDGHDDSFVLEEQEDKSWIMSSLDGYAKPFSTMELAMDELKLIINQRRYN